MPLLPFALLALQAATPMPMQKPEPVCIRAGDLPPAFARWNAAPRAGTGLTIGRPYVMTGVAPMTMTGATGVHSARAGKAAIARFQVKKAGVYRVGLDAGAWIDVVRGRKTAVSIAHTHGPICTGLRKIVDFRLVQGNYTLQLAGMPGDSVKVMIVTK